MSWQNKKVLYVDLVTQTSEVKSHPDLSKYIGGIGLGSKLMLDSESDDVLVFSVGPLNGFFPFASKTSVLFKDNGELQDTYLGGSLSTRLKFTGLDALVIKGSAKEPTILDIMDEKITFRAVDTDVGSLGLPGKRSVLDLDEKKATLDGYFESPKNLLHKVLIQKNLKSLVVTGSRTFEILDKERYEEIYSDILSRVGELTVEKSGRPSCSGCPVGCEESRVGEMSGDVLVHSVVACSFSEPVYSDVNTVFSCLNALGYGYTHEDIENLPNLVYDVLTKLKE